MRPRLFAFTLKQYGKNKGKAREANATVTPWVTPSPAHTRIGPGLNDSPSTLGDRSLTGSGMKSASESPSLLSPPHRTSRSPGPQSTRATTNSTTHVSPFLLRFSLNELSLPRVMLAQRLAELASANAEGLLEYVTSTHSLGYFELNPKSATTNIDCFARICSSDWVTLQYRRKSPLFLPPVQVDLASLGVRVYSWHRSGSVSDSLS